MFKGLGAQLRIFLPAWFSAAAFLLALPAQAQDITVGSAAALAEALADGRAPDGGPWTIRLLPGSYDAVLIKGVEGPVTLTAADAADRPRLTKLTVADSAGVAFQQLVIDYVFPDSGARLSDSPFRLYRSRDVRFDDVVFDGDLHRSSAAADDGFPSGRALHAKNIQGLTIRNSELRGFWLGVSIVRSSDIIFTGNDVHSLRKDGMNLSQVRNVLIEGNVFRDFHRSAASDDHADFVQLFSTNTDAPSEQVIIRNNLFNSGHGLYTQSIFFRNDRVDKGLDGPEMFFRDILVENNVIINAHLHGITIGETDGLTIRNNTLIRNRRSEKAGASEQLASPRINVAAASRNVRIESNIAYRFPKPQGPDWQVRNNLAIQDAGLARPGFYDLVFENARNGDPQDLASFRYRQGGPAAGQGIGAPQLEAAR